MPFSFKPPEGQPAPSAFSAESIGARIKESKGGIFSFVSYVVSISMIVVAGGLYSYNLKLTSEVDAIKEELKSQEGKLGKMPLNDMRKDSNRLKAAEQIVSNHISVNTAFRILEESIENQIVYSKFDLRTNPTLAQYELLISAKGPDYKSVAQQLDTYKAKPYTKYIQNSELISLGADEKGSVSFSIKANLLMRGVLPELVTFESPDAQGQTTPAKP